MKTATTAKKNTTTKKTAQAEGNLALKLENTPAPNKATISALLNSGLKMGNVTFCIIPVEMLQIEKTYQRVQCDFVRAIADHWDYGVCGSIKVNYRDGRLWVTDGQNRAAAAKLKGLEGIMCAVTEGEAVDNEIDAFVHQNQYVTKISPYDIFYARRHKSTDAVAHALQALFDKYHIVYENPNAGKPYGSKFVSRAPSSKAVGRMSCLYSVMVEADTGHLDRLENIFETVHKMGWHTMKNVYSKTFMCSMINAFRGRDPQSVQARFENVLSGQTPELIINKSRVVYDKLGPVGALTAYFNQILEGI